MYKPLLFLILACSIVASCVHSTENNDLTGNSANYKNDLTYQLDTNKIIDFVNHHASIHVNKETLIEFYKQRNFQFVWITPKGLNDKVSSVINLISTDASNTITDSLLYGNKLNELYNVFSNTKYQNKITASLTVQFELLLTTCFFEYAKRNWGSVSNDDLKTVDWFIKRKEINYEQLLDSILISNNNSTTFIEPVYRQYNLLKEFVKKYRSIEKKSTWQALDINTSKLKMGDSSLLIPLVKQQLFLLNDLLTKDTSTLFDNELEIALKKFQNRFGLMTNGRLNNETLKALNVSIHDRIQQLLINMERCKWVPVELKGDYLVVNIPEFKLHVYHDDTLKWNSNVIVGDVKPIHNTVIFNDTLEYIVFNPYWNIPANIIIKETLPAIIKNSDYLAEHNLEIINNLGKEVNVSTNELKQYTTHFPYQIRQKSGDDNSLGLVKFLFPNSYDIYLHDTPSKSLFNETSRTFSHGCIRVEEAFKLAKYLLKDNNDYSDKKIDDLVNRKKEKYVKLNIKVPVFIVYFTAFVDRNGKLNFREDIYHNDQKMKALLYGK